MKNKVTIIRDGSLDLETNSIAKKAFNLFLIPILNNLPRSFEKFIRKSHESAEEVIEHKTTHKALEVLYHKGNPKKKSKIIKKFFHWVWFGTNNSKAVRNRLKIVKKELEKALEINKDKDEIRFLSIASGSARAVIESIEKFDKETKSKMHVTFLDKNPLAIEYSKELAEMTPGPKYSWSNETVGTFFRNYSGNNFDVIEMVGLMDYFNDEKAVSVYSQIYNALNDGGTLVTANINDNWERKFITRAIGWNMIYRNVYDLERVVSEGGFSKEKMDLYYEPLMIHGIITAVK